MAVPKRKTSKARRNKRRTHQKLSLPGLSLCPSCHEAKLPHKVCPHCGVYKGKQVLIIEEI